jgi:hypothetical protein
MTLDFDTGKTYNRRRDIHSRFGGQQQGGIAAFKPKYLLFFYSRVRPANNMAARMTGERILCFSIREKDR